MNFNVVILFTISMVLMTFGQKDKEAEEVGMLKKGINQIFSSFSNQILPIVGEKKSTLVKIIDEHKKPLKKNLDNLKEKINDRMISIGFEVFEKGLDIAEIVQNMTSKIKENVLHKKP